MEAVFFHKGFPRRIRQGRIDPRKALTTTQGVFEQNVEQQRRSRCAIVGNRHHCSVVNTCSSEVLVVVSVDERFGCFVVK